MLKVIRMELRKLFKSKKLMILSLVIVVLGVFMAIGIKSLNGIENVDTIVTNGQSFPMFYLQQLATQVLPILLIIMTGGLIADEYRDGTLKLTLLRPVTRGELLAGKIVSLVVSIVIMLIVAMITGYIAGTAVFDWGDQTYFNLDSGSIEVADGLVKTFQYYAVTAVPFIGFGLIILLLSILIPNSGMVIGASIGIYFLMGVLPNIIKGLGDYLITSYMYAGMAVVSVPVFDSWVKAAVVMGVYIVGFGALSLITLKKKDIVF